MASDDPEFERKAADIVGLYLNPPQHAAVFCVRNRPFNRSTGLTRPCQCHQDAPRATVSNTIAMEPCRSTPPLDVRSGKIQGKVAARHINALNHASFNIR
ncbi:MAG: putative Transposase [Bryobacterales bacterium]|jgi:hypothetical protein|nr:putative Transposase [Bryobacterales bacterium]